jgi:hypothetical protein
MDNTKPLVQREAQFIHKKEDFITLRPGRDGAWLDFAVERTLKKMHCRAVEWLFCSEVCLWLLILFTHRLFSFQLNPATKKGGGGRAAPGFCYRLFWMMLICVFFPLGYIGDESEDE